MKSQTRLSDFTFTFHVHALEKEMATHSSVLAWRTPGTGEPGGLPSMGSHRVGHEWSDLAVAAYPYKTTGRTILLNRWTFVGKVISLLLNMLSRFVIAFLSKDQASFNFKAVVTICSDFGAQENKVFHCFHCFPIYLPWSDGTRCHDLSFLSVEF